MAREWDEAYDAELGCNDIVSHTLVRGDMTIEVDLHCTGSVTGYQIEPQLDHDEDESRRRSSSYPTPMSRSASGRTSRRAG